MITQPNHLWAQTSTTPVLQTFTDGLYDITFLHPVVADGGIINCNYGTSDCQPFNIANCNATALPIELSIAIGTQTNMDTAGANFYVWIQPNGNTCSYTTTTASDANIAVEVGATISGGLGSNYSLVSGSSGQPFDIPLDITPESGFSTFTTQSILNAFPNICDSNSGGVPLSTYTLCFGADNNNDGIVGPPIAQGITSTDVTGFFQFQVDTQPPPAPSIGAITSLVSQVVVDVDYDTSTNDIYQININSTSDAANVASGNCNTWNSNFLTQSMVSDTSGSASFSISGTNGVQYAYCATTTDWLGNVSSAAGPVYDSPHSECDFITCYPAALQTGYCGQSMNPTWYGLLGLFWLARRRYARARKLLLSVLLIICTYSIQAQAGDTFYGPQSSSGKFYYPKYGVEIRFSPYRPVISNNADVQRLYGLIFDASDTSLIHQHPMLLALEFDWYITPAFGLFGIYGRVGYWQVQGNSRKCFDGNTIIPCTSSSVLSTSVKGQDTCSLSTAPISIGMVYRFDYLRRSQDIPLLLTTKAGADYFLWWSGLGGSTSKYMGQPGQGGTLQLSASAAISLSLDFMSEKVVTYGKRPKQDNNYLFLEYSMVGVPGLFQKNKAERLNFSDDRLITLGFAMDFI